MAAPLATAPAKINLGLRIVGRRDDGYHLLDSLFVPLELADGVAVEIERGAAPAAGVRVGMAEVTAEDPSLAEGVPRDDTNLAVRAARAWLESAGAEAAGVRGVSIRLHKRIPAAAGLGGGSSDAAATLRLLAAALEGGPPGEALARLALSIGADVPFFLDPRPARVTGIGERVAPFDGLPAVPVVLANPGISLSTAAVYRAWDESAGRPDAGLTASGAGPTMRALSGLGADPNALERLPGFTNDLEAAAIRLCPPVAHLREGLREAGAFQAGMSGSGATVYGLFDSEAQARAARERVAAMSEANWTCVTRFRLAAGPREANEEQSSERESGPPA